MSTADQGARRRLHVRANAAAGKGDVGSALLFGVQRVSFEGDVERFWGSSIGCS